MRVKVPATESQSAGVHSQEGFWGKDQDNTSVQKICLPGPRNRVSEVSLCRQHCARTGQKQGMKRYTVEREIMLHSRRAAVVKTPAQKHSACPQILAAALLVYMSMSNVLNVID